MPILEFEVTRPATSKQLERVLFDVLPSHTAPVMVVTARLLRVDVPHRLGLDIEFRFGISVIYFRNLPARPSDATLVYRLVGQSVGEGFSGTIVIQFSELSDTPAQLSAVVGEDELARYVQAGGPAR